MEIPKEIQDWIDRDTNTLKNGSPAQIQEYMSWFKNPSRDTEHWHETAIQKVIKELNL